MRFAFISTQDGWQWGGSEELWSRAATQLKRDGHEVLASVAYRAKGSEKVIALSSQGIEIEFRMPETRGSTRHLFEKLSRAKERRYARLKRFRPDLVVISQGHNAGGFDVAKACREAGIPYAIVVQCNGEGWWFWDSVLADAVASYTCAQKVFCVSQANLDLLRLQVGEPLSNAELIWNPFNVSLEVTPRWPDESGRWEFANVARLDPAAKGQDLLLKIMSEPSWRRLPIQVNLFGSGYYQLELHRMAEMLQLRNVSFRGHVTDVRAIWEECHLLVLPSRYEGLPLALVEAMWCGRPAVVTNVGGNAELCIDGETGFVAPAATAASVNETLQRAWDRRSDWQEMGKAARERVEALVPKDPVRLFCDRLKENVAERSQKAELPRPEGSRVSGIA